MTSATIKKILLGTKTPVGLLLIIILFCLAGSILPSGRSIFSSSGFLAVALTLFVSLSYLSWILWKRNISKKFPPERWGEALLHLGIALIIASGIGSFFRQQRGFIQLIAGETFSGEPSKFLKTTPSHADHDFFINFQTQLLDFNQHQWPDGSIKSLESALLILDEGNSLKRKVSINHPAKFKNIRIYQSLYYGYTLSLALQDKSGKNLVTHFLLKQPKNPSLPAVAVNDFPTTDYIFKIRYYPQLNRTYLKVHRRDKIILAGRISPEQPLHLEDKLLMIEGIRPWSGLLFIKDDTTPLTLTGLILIVSGSFLIYLYPWLIIYLKTDGLKVNGLSLR